MSSAERRVLLVRPRYRTGLARAVHLVTEPLELEYLAAVAAARGWTWRIHDPVADGERLAAVLAAFKPDAVAIAGYYPARDAMLAVARRVKAWRGATRVAIGGVHAEVNPRDFMTPAVDVIVVAGGALTFGRWLETPAGVPVPGTWRRAGADWMADPPPASDDADPLRLPCPDRAHAARHRAVFRYLDRGPVALVKSAFGCPHDCRFCYCRLLNGGRHVARPVAAVADEIAALREELVWLVDDTFLIPPTRAAELADALAARGVRKRFIVYARATDIARAPARAGELRRMGVVEVIVGFEAVADAALDDFAKRATIADNRACVERLDAAGIACTGLFIVRPDAGWRDFRALARWVDSVPLAALTVSIFTPFPGTADWTALAERLTTRDCRRWDLCHLVLPSRLPRPVFYGLYIWMHLRFVWRRPRLRRLLLARLLKWGGAP